MAKIIQKYLDARKQALAEHKKALASKSSPYLPSLDSLLSHENVAHEEDLGLIDIPMDKIIGTRTDARTPAFATNFMPLLPENSEFAYKWMSLYEAHLEEGIRDPIVAYEYMNNYYVVEGNKRVSVMKYSGAVSIPGYVTRVVPAYQDTEEIRLYYEFLEFYSFSRMNTVYFSCLGDYRSFCDYLGLTYGEHWDTEKRREIEALFSRFKSEFNKKAAKTDTKADDAFLYFLKTFGYEALDSFSAKDVRAKINALWDDITKLNVAGNVQLLTAPEEDQASFVRKIFAPKYKIKCAFLYFRNPETSVWTFGHELSRQALEKRLDGEIETFVYQNLDDLETCIKAADDAISKGCTVLFLTSPRFLDAAAKLSVKYPNAKILNCALNNFAGGARTYYGRLYEAKHLLGMLAGTYCTQDTIGYVAEYPIAGVIADINAFALGVRATNANAKIKLLWNAKKGESPVKQLKEEGIEILSCREFLTSGSKDRFFGLCKIEDGQPIYIASPRWEWHKFYERIIRTVQNGAWDNTKLRPEFGSLNYWWGMSSGVVDVIYSRSISASTMKILDLVKERIMKGDYKVFEGEILDRDGKIHTNKEVLSQEDIINMNWLCENVDGYIPGYEEFNEDVWPMLKILGVNAEGVNM